MNQVAAQSGNGQALFNLDTCLFSKCHKIWVFLTKEVHRWGRVGYLNVSFLELRAPSRYLLRLCSWCAGGGAMHLIYFCHRDKTKTLKLMFIYLRSRRNDITQEKQLRQLQDRTDFQRDRTDFFNFEIISKCNISKSNGQK